MPSTTPAHRWGKSFSTAGAMAIAAVALSTVLSACGGGGGSGSASGGSCVTIDPSRPANLPGCPTTGGTGVAGKPSLALALTDATGATIGAVTPGAAATLTAIVRDANGAGVPNTLVTFVSSDKNVVFTPASGSVVSDAAGRAVVQVGAGATTASGGYAITASASVAGAAVTSSAGYTVTVPTLTLSAPVIAPTTLAAGGTASLTVTATTGTAVYTPALTVAFTSPCATAGKARISSPVATVNGVASTSYTDLGCGGNDVITASTVYNGNTITSSASIAVQPASAGQLAFVSALPQNIALKGTGGAGRQESSTVTFKVLDRNGNPVSGQAVNFTLNTNVGGLTLNPATATTGSGGLVTTTVAGGTVNTPVRVTATLAGTTLSTLSDQLVVSTGVPEQNSFTLSALVRNLEGGQFNGCPAPSGTIITARLADHFHNPAPDGTAVSFTAEGGSIDASCLTGLTNTTLTDGTVVTQKGIPGECTVRYCAGNPRPADGRVSILAYALGEESFVDVNGNNRYEAGELYTDLGEPFRNDRAITDGNANGIDDIWKAGNAARASAEPYIDSNGSGGWNQNGNGIYNGVLQTVPNVDGGNTVHVRQGLVLVLSNSAPRVTLLDQAVDGAPVVGTLQLNRCTTGTKFVNEVKSFRFAIRDDNPTVFANNLRSAHPNDPSWLFDGPGNPLPAGTTILFSTSNGLLLGAAASPTGVVVPNTNAADSSAWTYSVELLSDAVQGADLSCADRAGNGSLTITITTPTGRITSFTYPVAD